MSRMKLIDSINWRSNAISKFESAISIQQRFCALNAIGTTNFLDFVLEVGAITRKKKVWVPTKDLARINMCRLGQVLREGNRLNESGLEHYYPFVYPLSAWSYQKFRYCPVCIDRGYHAPFHQVDWLSHCLIHSEKLITKCVNCGRNLVVDSLQSRFPLARYCCIGCGKSLWPEVRAVAWPEPLTAKDLAPVAEYVEWVGKWPTHRRLSATQHADALAAQIDPAKRVDAVARLIGRPLATAKAWQPQPSQTQRQFRFSFGRQKSKLIAQCIAEFGFVRLIGFVSRPWSDLEGAMSFKATALRLARHLEHRHTSCRNLENDVMRTAGDMANDFSYKIYSLCLPSYLAASLRTRYANNTSGNHDELESVSDCRYIIKDWLISAGLLREHKHKQRHENSLLDGIAQNAGDNFRRWRLDKDLVQVVNLITKERLWAEVDFFLSHYSEPYRHIAVTERKNAFRAIWPVDLRDAGVFLLAFAQGDDLVVASWRDNILSHKVKLSCQYDDAHVKMVSRRASVTRDYINAGRTLRWTKLRAELAKFER